LQDYEVNDDGYRAFRKRLRKSDEVALEAAGSSGYFCEKISDRVKRVLIINPRKFRVISDSVNKTDENDAKLIAQYLKLGI
jgi:transposase